jgi:hypothetical protein
LFTSHNYQYKRLLLINFMTNITFHVTSGDKKVEPSMHENGGGLEDQVEQNFILLHRRRGARNPGIFPGQKADGGKATSFCVDACTKADPGSSVAAVKPYAKQERAAGETPKDSGPAANG